MKALIQRVSAAEVKVDDCVVGSIGKGLVVFLGIARTDTLSEASYIVNKVVNIRLFDNNVGLFDLSPLDVQAELLVVSQFTLHAQTRKGRRPSFIEAMVPEQAEVLYKETLQLFQKSGLVIATGIFKSHMNVTLTNDGPVTLMIDSADRTSK